MSRISKRELVKVLEKLARGYCPVLPMQKLTEHEAGKLVGRAMGIGGVMRALVEAEILGMSDYDTLNAALSNRPLEDILAERKQLEELNAHVAELEEEEITPEQE